MAKKLTNTEVERRLEHLDGWELNDEDGSINKHFVFDDFDEAMAFVNDVADIARAMDHHPELYNVYNEVTLSLITHDVDGLTEKDLEFARRVEAMLAEEGDAEDEEEDDEE